MEHGSEDADPGDALRLDDVEVTRARRWMNVLAFALLIASLVVSIAALQAQSAALETVALFVVGGGILGFVALLAAAVKWPLRARGALRIRSGEISVDGTRVLERSAVKKAIATQVSEDHLVSVHAARWQNVTMRVADADAADRLLSALGQQVGQRTTSFACEDGGSSRSLRFVGWAAGAAVLNVLYAMLQKHLGVHLPVVTPLLFVVAAVLSMHSRSCTIVAGADGFSVKTFGRRAYFVPFSRVREVRREEGAVHVSIEGVAAPLRLGYAKANLELPLYQRLQAGYDSAKAGPTNPARALLLKGTSTRQQWRRRLVRLTSGDDDYRSASLPTEHLWTVLSDPRELAEVRAAAAAAIRHQQLDDGQRERLRIAAEATADLPLRRVFTAVNARDERAFEEAFDELDAEQSRAAQMSVRRDVST